LNSNASLHDYEFIFHKNYLSDDWSKKSTMK